MGFVLCRKCGKEWDNYHISYEIPLQQRLEFREGRGCPVCRIIDTQYTWEKEMAWSSIRANIDEISNLFITFTLKYAQKKRKGSMIVAGSDLFKDLEEFFISCQKVEERIKHALKKGFLSKEDIKKLNLEIGNDVSTILTIARDTPQLADSIKELAEVRPAVMGILQSFASPDLYYTFQYFKRKHDPDDLSSLYRMTWERRV